MSAWPPGQVNSIFPSQPFTQSPSTPPPTDACSTSGASVGAIVGVPVGAFVGVTVGEFVGAGVRVAHGVHPPQVPVNSHLSCQLRWSL